MCSFDAALAFVEAERKLGVFTTAAGCDLPVRALWLHLPSNPNLKRNEDTGELAFHAKQLVNFVFVQEFSDFSWIELFLIE